MQSRIFAIVAGSALLFASVGAEAMPIAPVSGASAGPQIERTAEGCGPGFARGPAGRCRRIARAPVVVVPAPRVVVAPRRVVRPGCAGVRVGPVAVRGC